MTATPLLPSDCSKIPSLLLRAFVCCLAALVVGCAGEPAKPTSKPSDEPLVLTLAGQPFKIEVASTNSARQLGLMYRKSLPADAGMVFVFKREQELDFWMKDTSIPLDIVFLDKAGKVVSIKQMAPFDLGQTSSDAPAKYAVELNQGTASRIGLKTGDAVNLPAAVQNPPELE